MENFDISGVPLSHYQDMIRGLAVVKLAAARANHQVGNLNREVLKGIEAACTDLLDGELTISSWPMSFRAARAHRPTWPRTR